MKNYTITVNGVAYDVVVEEKGAGAVVAPQDGTVAGINVSVGQAVESGDLLASLN